MTGVHGILAAAKVVFWDFDGVIKESVAVKSAAFYDLFLPFGQDVATRVKEHHLANGGMSRFKKVPLYLSWAGVGGEDDTAEAFCKRFAAIVEDGVVASEWVPGVREFLSGYNEERLFVLVTATPQGEIESIVRRLEIESCFNRTYGAPTSKSAAIRRTLLETGIEAASAVMIGDSREDMNAAEECGIGFLLRRTPENLLTLPTYNGPLISNFE